MKQEEVVTLAKTINAEVKETHISWVLLTHEYAYKIRKPVKFSFLDFSTLKKRWTDCKNELRLNKDLSKDVYKDVISIRKSGSRFELGGKDGKVIDYAIQMLRLDSSKEMEKVIDKASVKQIEDLATIVSNFHKKAEVRKAFSLEVLRNDFMELSEILKNSRELFSEKILLNAKKAFMQADNFIHRNTLLFKKRVQHGFIRDVHGDLHMGNIFLTSPPIIFDRIEFNPKFRIIDIFKEITMLAMDLEASDRMDLSKAFLNKYFHNLKIKLNAEEEDLINFYMAFAANVRAKVVLLKNHSISTKELRAAKIYLKLMGKYSGKVS